MPLNQNLSFYSFKININSYLNFLRTDIGKNVFVSLSYMKRFINQVVAAHTEQKVRPQVSASLAAIDNAPDRLRKALELAEGNRDRAAKLLGISRTTLWRRMRAYALDG